MKKLLSLILAFAMISSLCLCSFAARGYDKEETVKKDPVFVSGTAAAETVKQSLKEMKVKKSVNGSVATVSVVNVKEVKAETLKAVAEEAKKNNAKPVLSADKIVGNKVVARVAFYADEVVAKGLDIKLGVETDNKSTRAVFEKFFDNEIAIVSFEQKNTFGTNVRASVSINLSKLNKESLKFYSYDAATNTYLPIATPNYVIDANGYLVFSTINAGDIIVTDKALTLK